MVEKVLEVLRKNYGASNFLEICALANISVEKLKVILHRLEKRGLIHRSNRHDIFKEVVYLKPGR